jgi:hypothetical protein
MLNWLLMTLAAPAPITAAVAAPSVFFMNSAICQIYQVFIDKINCVVYTEG